MLDLLGSGYVVEHCIAAIQKEQEERAYQYYMTDVLRNAFNVEKRFYDMLNHPETLDKKDGDEIILDVITRGGLTVVTE